METLAASQTARAAAALRAGGLVAFPTETVYGLGADATRDRAVAAVFAVKGRPSFNPLIVHVADTPAAMRLVMFNDAAHRLAKAFWPGPLSLILTRRDDCPVSLLCSAGLDTVAVRIPAHPTALALLAAAGRPIAAPSANRSGRVSPTTAAHVAAEFPRDAGLILDGGPCRVGLESTVLDLTGETPILLRPGAVTLEALAALIGPVRQSGIVEDGVARSSPGLLASHYAPSLPLGIDVTDPPRGSAFIGFGPPPLGIRAPDANLSRGGDLEEAAAALFATLRAFDRPPFTSLAVMPIPDRGIGRAINDRLRRAAAPR
jgi:L-threonylcarbamoyladenylate synthase